MDEIHRIYIQTNYDNITKVFQPWQNNDARLLSWNVSNLKLLKPTHE